MERRDSEDSCTVDREAIKRIASEVPAMMVEVPGEAGGEDNWRWTGVKVEESQAQGEKYPKGKVQWENPKKTVIRRLRCCFGRIGVIGVCGGST